MNVNIPLESQTNDFGKLDTMQRNLICKYKALDVVLIENANELFRVFMQEGYKNNNLEILLELISKERKNSIYLPSATFKINLNKKSNWFFSRTKENKELLKKYTEDCNTLVKKINNNSIIYTTIGLDLGEGGHYGSIICDVKKRKIIIFDSMTGGYEEGYNISGVESIFKKLAIQIFLGDKEYNGIHYLNKISEEFTIESVLTPYILQATGGFETYISPILYSIDKTGKKKILKEINIQHVDSQNHFCYIWSIWFLQIYLRGGFKLYQKIIGKLQNSKTIPLIVIKKYILSFINLIGNIEYPNFFYTNFSRIWSNHENPLENDFNLYSFSYSKGRNISDCLSKSLEKLSLKEIKTTQNGNLC
mgnify:CR=1 FL=1|tara:strand:+ start:3143 stop:4231 length:1089 start_codon:yes stop_codon:yes gene_type:complete